MLFLSMDGDSLGVAQRVAHEGHDVKFYIKSPGFGKAGSGFVSRVNSWRPHVKTSDLVVCDMVGFGKHADIFKRSGVPVLSCNKMTDMMELDRDKGIELFRKSGINVPKTFSFGSPKAAADQLTEMPSSGGFVIKPSGNISTAKTLVCRDLRTFTWALTTYADNQNLIVQELVEGVEVSTEGWFNGRDWIKPFNHTFEEKRLMPGNLGPQTGCMGNVVITSTGDKLIDETVKKLSPFLKRVGYRGPVDVNTMVNADGVFALEATTRMGYDAVEALMEGLNEPVTDLLFETAIGVKKNIDVSPHFLLAVRVSVPPWPGGDPRAEDVGRPIIIKDKKALDHIFFTDAYKESGEYKYAAGDGVVCKVTASGRDVREAQRRVKRTLGNISILDMQYRADIGDRVTSDMEQLKMWGYM